MRITWRQALAWRLGRNLLEPVAALDAEAVVRRLCAVQAQVASSAELAIRLRRQASAPGDVARALADGRLIKTWAMRGTLHLLTAEDAGAFLSLMAAGRSWERPSWQRYFGMREEHWKLLRPAVREALDGRAMTRDELIAAVTARPGLDHIGEALRSGWGTLLKPLAYQGDLCFGPNRGQNVTFTRPEAASERWTGLPPVEEAAETAITAYLGAYGPATADSFANWVARGWLGKRQVQRWFGALRDRLVEVDVEGEPGYVLAEHADELLATKPSDGVRLLGGFDQWVLGPGTDDGHVTPPARRSAVSKQSGWIAPVAIVGGVVAGTWELDGTTLRLGWFEEAGAVPRGALDAETRRLGDVLGKSLRVCE